MLLNVLVGFFAILSSGSPVKDPKEGCKDLLPNCARIAKKGKCNARNGPNCGLSCPQYCKNIIVEKKKKEDKEDQKCRLDMKLDCEKYWTPCYEDLKDKGLYEMKSDIQYCVYKKVSAIAAEFDTAACCVRWAMFHHTCTYQKYTLGRDKACECSSFFKFYNPHLCTTYPSPKRNTKSLKLIIKPKINSFKSWKKYCLVNMKQSDECKACGAYWRKTKRTKTMFTCRLRKSAERKTRCNVLSLDICDLVGCTISKKTKLCEGLKKGRVNPPWL